MTGKSETLQRYLGEMETNVPSLITHQGETGTGEDVMGCRAGVGSGGNVGGVNYGYFIGNTDLIRLFELRKVLQFKKRLQLSRSEEKTFRNIK